MKILLILGVSVVLMALVFSGLAIKMFFKKNGQFEKKSCGSTTGDKSSSCGCGN